MVKLDFNYKNDGQFHRYCIECRVEGVDEVKEDGKKMFKCSSCGHAGGRSIDIDPNLTWWESDDKEYWHDSGGIFVCNKQGKYLFFERTMFPFVLGMPGGHVDAGEDPKVSAFRELKEEVGLVADELELISREPIVGDSCRRGCDSHVWNAYKYQYDGDDPIVVEEEGEKPVWLTVEEALDKDLIFPARFIFEKYRDRF